MDHDIVINNARIVDGTGSPWYCGSIGIANGRIETIDRKRSHNLTGDTEINADELMVSPGFVDVHSHSGLRLFEEPTSPPKIRQGVTTEIVGQDGYSMAPMYREEGSTEWQQLLSGLDGQIDEEWWTWQSTDEYLIALEDRGIAQNVAMLVGHGTVRYNVLGLDDRSPTEEELEEMCGLVTEALEQGAVGFSTGLVYPPQVNAEPDEVQALASQLRPYNRPFFAHIRSQGRWIWEAIEEFFTIGAEEDIPLHYSHLSMCGNRFNHGQASRAIELLEDARDRGIDVTADHHFYTRGSTMLQAILPPWLQAHEPKEIVEKLRHPEVRNRVKRDIEEWRIDWWENYAMRNGWENTIVTSVVSASNKDLEGKTITEIAAQRDVEPAEAACQLLVEEELEVSMIQKSLLDDDVRTVLSSERVAVASDGLLGENPHPRSYGTYPQVLGQYSREENLLSVEESVRKMTSLPARAVGLSQKGILHPGKDADIVMFEEDLVRDRATYDQPEQHPAGVPHVIVNGEFVVRDGEVTGRTPGKALRA